MSMVSETENIAIQRLKAAREKARMSQLELSYRSGVSQNTIVAIETGKSSPTLTTLIKITDALNINLSELFVIPNEKREKEKEQIIDMIKKL